MWGYVTVAEAAGLVGLATQEIRALIDGGLLEAHSVALHVGSADMIETGALEILANGGDTRLLSRYSAASGEGARN